MPAPLGNPVFQWVTPAGAPAVGYQVFSYAAGTSTPLATYPTFTDATNGTNANANPVVLDANGTAQIWLANSLYKIVLETDLSVTVWTVDNVSGSGTGGGGASASSQWVPFAGNPTYVSSTQFTVAGDQRPTFVVGTRVKSTNTGGTTYSQITTSTFASSTTTVTVINTSGTLDSGLSAVATGIITIANNALPIFSNIGVLGTTATGSNGVGVIGNLSTVVGDLLGEMTTGASGSFTPLYAGTYYFAGYMGITSSSGTTGISGVNQQAHLYKNGVSSQQWGVSAWPFADSLVRQVSIPCAGVLTLAAGDVVTFRGTLAFAGTAPTFYFGGFSIERLS